MLWVPIDEGAIVPHLACISALGGLRGCISSPALPKEPTNVVVRCGQGLKLADIWVLCRDSLVVTLAELTHHCSGVIKGELRAMLDDLHTRFGVCGQFMVPSAVFALHVGDTWVNRVL